jgi:prepilin peptidase CpaA
MPIVIACALFAFVLTCCVIDVRTRRIPNAVSASAIVAGLALNGVAGGLPALGWSLCGALAMIAILFTPFALGGLGGGDVKMMAAVGAFLGPRLAALSLVTGMILGGVVVAVHLARLGILRERIQRLKVMLFAATITGSVEPLRMSPDQEGAISLPYSIPLGIGTVAVVMTATLLQSTSF